MTATYAPTPISIQAIIDEILATRRITRLDQQRFMMAALSNTVTPQDCARINQVFDALQRGLLRVVD
jgi:hypothetical protein